MHQDGDGGCTAYVGRRASDRYLRVYNKEAECRSRDDLDQAAHYVRCWRYELQTGGSVAYSSLRLACASSDRPAFIMLQLAAYSLAHGITPVFTPTHDAPLVPGFRRRSDAETRMAWLKRAVNPAILTLLEVKDRGDILEALGLGGGPEVPPRPAGVS
jgi:Putative phage replication protein RstA